MPTAQCALDTLFSKWESRKEKVLSCSCRFHMPCPLGAGGSSWQQRQVLPGEEVATCSSSKHLQHHPRIQPHSGHFGQSMALAPAQKPHGVLALSWVSLLAPCHLKSSCSAGEQVTGQHRNKREGSAVPLIAYENAKKEMSSRAPLYDAWWKIN